VFSSSNKKLSEREERAFHSKNRSAEFEDSKWYNGHSKHFREAACSII
jgi:hypothetical protein